MKMSNSSIELKTPVRFQELFPNDELHLYQIKHGRAYYFYCHINSDMVHGHDVQEIYQKLKSYRKSKIHKIISDPIANDDIWVDHMKQFFDDLKDNDKKLTDN